jgi:orotate phosphoribosyltransferase
MCYNFVKKMNNIAKLLISMECLKLSPAKPFTYASGLKGPVYCDNRKVLSNVSAREEILNAWKKEILPMATQFEVLAGLATAGIPWAAMLSDHLKLPMIYVRGKPKEHGKQNQVEGDYRSGQKVLLIEDLVNQGKSLGEAIEGCHKADLNVVGAFCIVDYQMPASAEVLSKYKIPLYSLTNFSQIITIAQDLKLLKADEIDLLKSWHQDPVNWAKKA